ncbi:hypothetical protein JOD66_000284 [Nocardioides nitrophenolicus]|nr:hypothetical protein [Nocardioides nitrophenolicus]
MARACRSFLAPRCRARGRVGRWSPSRGGKTVGSRKDLPPPLRSLVPRSLRSVGRASRDDRRGMGRACRSFLPFWAERVARSSRHAAGRAVVFRRSSLGMAARRSARGKTCLLRSGRSFLAPCAPSAALPATTDVGWAERVARSSPSGPSVSLVPRATLPAARSSSVGPALAWRQDGRLAERLASSAPVARSSLPALRRPRFPRRPTLNGASAQSSRSVVTFAWRQDGRLAERLASSAPVARSSLPALRRPRFPRRPTWNGPSAHRAGVPSGPLPGGDRLMP